MKGDIISKIIDALMFSELPYAYLQIKGSKFIEQYDIEAMITMMFDYPVDKVDDWGYDEDDVVYVIVYE